MDALRSDAGDLAVGHWAFLPAGLDDRVVGEDELVVALAEAHPLNAAEHVSLRELADEPFVTLPAGSALVEALHREAARVGVVPRITQVAPDSATLIALVRAGVGCSLTLASVRRGVPVEGVRFVRLDPAPDPVLLRMAWRSDDRAPALRIVLGVASALRSGPTTTAGHASLESAAPHPVLDHRPER